MLLNLVIFFSGVILVWLGITTFFLVKMYRHYQKLAFGVAKGNLISVLEKLIKDQKVADEQIEEINSTIKLLKEENKLNLQKNGFVRFNPFSDAGGNQSFALAILNGKDSGVVLSSLHGRDLTRVYAKPIKEGKPQGFDLSKEEQEAIDQAKKGK